jgi:hypothetical protein
LSDFPTGIRQREKDPEIKIQNGLAKKNWIGSEKKSDGNWNQAMRI